MAKPIPLGCAPAGHTPLSVAMNFWQSRAAAALVGAGITLGVLLYFAGRSSMLILQGLLIDGLIVPGWMLGATGLGWAALDALRLGGQQEPRLFRLVTAAATGLGILSLLILGMALAGWLNHNTTISLMVAGLVCGLAKIARVRQKWNWNRLRKAMAKKASWASLWLLATPFLAVALLGALSPPGVLWGGEPNGYDVVAYHLQVPREWFEAGRMMPLHHNVFSYFPFNVEMHYLAAMHLHGGPWAGMYTAQLMHVAFMVLCVLAVAAVAAALAEQEGRGNPLQGDAVSPTPAGGCRNSSRCAAIAGVAAATVPWLTLLAGVAYNEGGLLLFGTLAVGWAMLALRSASGPLRPMLVGGAMAGFACGTKLTGVPMLLMGVPIAVLAGLLAIRQMRKLLSWLPALGAFVLMGMVTFSPWLLRNAIWTGNPVFPELPQLGHRPFDDTQVQRWRQAHSPRADQQVLAARLHAAWTEIVADYDPWSGRVQNGSPTDLTNQPEPAAWRFGYLLLPLGLAAWAASMGRGQSWIAGILLAVLSIFFVGFTHLQGRFFVLAIPLLALLVGQVRWKLWPAIALTAIVLQAGLVAGPWLAAMLNQDRFRLLAEHRLLWVEDLSFLRTGNLGADEKINGRIRLIGDARAFVYQTPMSRLTYRTVFDIRSDGGSAIAGWLAGQEIKPGDVLVVDNEQLDRLHRTYWKIPGPPAGASGILIERP